MIRTGCAVAIGCFMMAAIPTRAQEGGPGPGGSHRRGPMMTPEERTEHLTKALSLGDDQKGKVLAVFQDEQKQMQALRSDSTLSRDDRWSKMREIHQSTTTQIRGILTPDQAKKFDELQQRMQEHREQRGNTDKDSAPPPSPQ